jgi:hypothetical protein
MTTLTQPTTAAPGTLEAIADAQRAFWIDSVRRCIHRGCQDRILPPAVRDLPDYARDELAIAVGQMIFCLTHRPDTRLLT